MDDHVQFYYDHERQHAYWCCPHMDAFSSLPSCIWRVDSITPLSVTPSIRDSRCGCHGWIRDGKWEALT